MDRAAERAMKLESVQWLRANAEIEQLALTACCQCEETTNGASCRAVVGRLERMIKDTGVQKDNQTPDQSERLVVRE